MFTTFCLVVIGWIFFRAETMAQAFDYMKCMVTNSFIGEKPLNEIKIYIWLIMCITLLVVEWLQRDKSHALQFPDCHPFDWQIVRYAVYICILFSIILLMGEVQTFIYFQF